MGIRQKPITTEKEFLKALKIVEGWEGTIFIQYKNPSPTEPEVVTAENYIFDYNDPNDAWYFIENGSVRAWFLYPNKDERDIPWK